MSKERPILFSGAMVNAIREGRKTQTRRVMKPQPEVSPNGAFWHWPHLGGVAHWEAGSSVTRRWQTDTLFDRCPYGQPGDRLWVRETWHTWGPPERQILEYRADCLNPQEYTWRPSIFMPRQHSRITLEVVSGRVERVQDISRDDVKAEGIAPYTFARGVLADPPHDPRWKFIELWDSINEKRGYGWAVNPWVWVVEFKAVQP